MSVRSLRYNSIEQHFTKGVTASTDRDALAFLEAAQIYNANQQRAIVNLVRSLKRVGLWSKMKAIYPFVGGTATSHKWNLKDPRDSSAGYRLVFYGGWTHSANGADPNGTSGYADTFLNQNVLGQNNIHYSTYVRENTAADSAEIGIIASNPTRNSTYIFPRLADNRCYVTVNQTNQILAMQSTVTTSAGMTAGSRLSASACKIYRNGSVLATGTQTSSAPEASPFYLGAINEISAGNIQYYSNRQIAFATIGDGLTDTDATNLYNIVDLYQRRLGRNV